jgi:hypothetical protein
MAKVISPKQSIAIQDRAAAIVRSLERVAKHRSSQAGRVARRFICSFVSDASDAVAAADGDELAAALEEVFEIYERIVASLQPRVARTRAGRKARAKNRNAGLSREPSEPQDENMPAEGTNLGGGLIV